MKEVDIKSNPKVKNTQLPMFPLSPSRMSFSDSELVLMLVRTCA